MIRVLVAPGGVLKFPIDFRNSSARSTRIIKKIKLEKYRDLDEKFLSEFRRSERLSGDTASRASIQVQAQTHPRSERKSRSGEGKGREGDGISDNRDKRSTLMQRTTCASSREKSM